ncbi:MAG: DUF2634 domain-containing protein [Sarcina sp.]
MSIFPQLPTEEDLNIQYTEDNDFIEYAVDFEKEKLLYNQGKNIIWHGKDALKVWIWKALKTAKNKYKAYTNFGNEYNDILNKSYSRELAKSLLYDSTKQALLKNKFILRLDDFHIEIDGALAIVSAKVATKFGEVIIENV